MPAVHRFNDNGKHPNHLIGFITPLKGSTESAINLLTQIAAIVYPIMKKEGMEITTLDEFPSNKEFWGRNWNGGECVELVLYGRSGSILPFNVVLGTMLHEMAHCHHMNHSKKFWAYLGKLKSDMQVLLDKGYTGEKFYSQGQRLSGQDLNGGISIDKEDIPSHVCAGIWSRSKTRKRKVKIKDLSGTKLDANLDIRQSLEGGRTNATKPRVAQSARGRELRANAALARLEKLSGASAVEDEYEETIKETKMEESKETKLDLDSEINDMIIPNFRQSKLAFKPMHQSHIPIEEDGKDHQKTQTVDDIECQIVDLTSDSRTEKAAGEKHNKRNQFASKGDGVQTKTIRICPVCSYESYQRNCELCSCALLDNQAETWRCDRNCGDGLYRNLNETSLCGACGCTRLS